MQREEAEYIQLPTEMVIPFNENSDPLSDLVTVVFPRLSAFTFDPNKFTSKAMLTPMNEGVDKINASL